MASSRAIGLTPRSTPCTATSVSTKAATETPVVTSTRRSAEKGSSRCPAVVAVITKPAIIITQTMVAAGARRSGTTLFASSTSSEVPAAPTPTPMSTKASIASTTPPARLLAIHAVATAARAPPIASTAMPPTIQGVRRPPTSEP